MDMNLEICNDKKEWDKFVESSPQGNPFCSSYFLKALNENYELTFIKKDKVIQLGAVVLKSGDQPIVAPYAYTMYQGIMFSEISREMPYHKRSKWALELIAFLLSEMEKRFKRISFCLHYGVDDIRGFQWFHYHEPKDNQFKIELRYTGILDLSGINEFDNYLEGIRKVRRYEYRQALKNGLIVEEVNDLDLLVKLHDLTFERQGIKNNERQRQLVRDISEAVLIENSGKLLLCRDKTGKPASISLFLYDNKCGYYLFGANDPEYLNAGSGTYLLLEQIRCCKERGIKIIDFIGINSPNRGDFKTSFNARPVPYFVVTWEKHDQ
jgi:hypothetical protein